MFKKFTNEESGAVTVDWVVLCGAVVALAIGVVAALSTGLDAAASNISAELSGFSGIDTSELD